MSSTSSKQLVWLITGSSAGLGLSLVRSLLLRNDLVVATARSPKTAERLVALQAQYPDSCKILQLDVTDDFSTLKERAKEAVGFWGRVDVVVNNAGFSIIGLTEESGADSYHEMYKTNVFGPVNVTNAFLPYMRGRQSGTVVFVGSRSGWRTEMPMNAIYGSSKAALHAIADGLATELSPFNIRVLSVIPGGLRTENIDHVYLIRGREKAVFTEAQNPSGTQEAPVDDSNTYASPSDNNGAIQGYNDIFNYVVQYLVKTNGSQTGDSDKAANVVVDVVRGEGVMELEDEEGNKTGEMRAWPGTLYLGSDAARDIRAKCDKVVALLDDWEEVAKGIDVDN